MNKIYIKKINSKWDQCYPKMASPTLPSNWCLRTFPSSSFLTTVRGNVLSHSFWQEGWLQGGAQEKQFSIQCTSSWTSLCFPITRIKGPSWLQKPRHYYWPFHPSLNYTKRRDIIFHSYFNSIKGLKWEMFKVVYLQVSHWYIGVRGMLLWIPQIFRKRNEWALE